MHRCLSLLVVVSILATVVRRAGFEPAHAQPIYTGTTQKGTVVYSSRPQGAALSRKALPEIMRTGRPAVKVKGDIGCARHGGVNCSAGPDQDGSVICQDGYLGASSGYRWSCPVAKLVVVRLEQPEESFTASIVVRNKGRVQARNPKIFVKGNTKKQLDLKGPETLDAQGIAQYEIYVPPQTLAGGSRKLLWNNLWITCDSCG